MTDLDDEDEQLSIADVVDDAEVAGPHPPLPGAADELPRPGGTGLLGQEVDGRLDPPAAASRCAGRAAGMTRPNVPGGSHRLFDRGMLGLDDDLAVVVSQRFSARTPQGRALYDLHGRRLRP